MKIEKWYVVLDPKDDGLTVYRALGRSIQFVSQNYPEAVTESWIKKCQDAEGTIGDYFGIVGDKSYFRRDRDAPLFMRIDYLELMIVNYGCELLNENGGVISDEIIAIDGVLREIDKTMEINQVHR